MTEQDRGVAQLEARLVHTQKVGGSSPPPATMKEEAFAAINDFVPYVQPTITALEAAYELNRIRSEAIRRASE